MRAEHKQYIFKAITKTFDKPELLAISTISQKHLYQRFMVYIVNGEMTGTKTTVKVTARKLLSENNGRVTQK